MQIYNVIMVSQNLFRLNINKISNKMFCKGLLLNFNWGN